MAKELVIERSTTFTGKRKIGLDSNFIINILDNEIQFSALFLKFSEHSVVYIHEESLREVPEVLSRDYKWDLNEAKKKLETFIKVNNIQIVKKDRENPLLPLLYDVCQKKGIAVHPPDSWIIADFAQEGINKVYSGDNVFLQAARVLHLDTQKTPTLDRRIIDQLRALKGFTKYRKGR